MSPRARVQYVEHAGWRVGMVHDVEAIPAHIDTPRQLAAKVYGDASPDILIAGDSHFERLVHRDGVLAAQALSKPQSLTGPSTAPRSAHRKRRSCGVERSPDASRATVARNEQKPGTSDSREARPPHLEASPLPALTPSGSLQDAVIQ